MSALLLRVNGASVQQNMKSCIPNVPLSTNVTVPVRLRRAIHLNDLVLVQRIVKKNPDKLQNPDFEDNGNTSLHLAAQLALLEIAVSPSIPACLFGSASDARAAIPRRCRSRR